MRWLVITLSMMVMTVNAKNLGVVGTTYPIIEMDMLDWIQHRLSHMQQTGELAQKEAEMKAQVSASVTRPPPVAGLTTTTTPTIFYRDPTLTLHQDIKDDQGKVLFPKGLKINPFDSSTWPNGARLPTFTLSKQLVFIDGDDVQQVRFAQRYQAQQKEGEPAIKWVLVKGEPNKASKQLNARIYFDQGGNISRQLTIKHIPSIAKQAGTQWQIREYDVSKESLAPLSKNEDH